MVSCPSWPNPTSLVDMLSAIATRIGGDRDATSKPSGGACAVAVAGAAPNRDQAPSRDRVPSRDRATVPIALALGDLTVCRLGQDRG
jgi:hypothetical protein